MIANMIQKVQIGLIIVVPLIKIQSSLIAVLINKNIEMLIRVYIIFLKCIYVEFWAITLIKNQS